MTPEKQIQANRLNAMKSTGPRTEAGKKVSRLNALRHGFRSSMPLLPGEDPEQLENLRESLHEACKPTDALQEILVAQMVDSEWKRQRLNRCETGLMYYRHCIANIPPRKLYQATDWPETQEAESLFRYGRLTQDLTGEDDHLSPLERYGAGARRAFFQALKALIACQQLPATQRPTTTQVESNPAIAPQPPEIQILPNEAIQLKPPA